MAPLYVRFSFLRPSGSRCRLLLAFAIIDIMTTPRSKNAWQTTANVFGTLGYLSLVMQWTWGLVIFAYPLITDPNSFIMKRDTDYTPPTITIPASPILAVVLAAISLAVLVFTVVTIIRLPKAVGKTGAKITHTASNLIVPAIVHHQPISKKRRLKLSFRIVLALKLLLLTLPVASLTLAPTLEVLPHNAMLVVGALGALITLADFILQYAIATIARIPRSAIW